MPLIKSAIKRARQSTVRHTRLTPFKTKMKTMIKKITDLVKEGKKTEAQAVLAEAYKAIDTAAKKGVVHRNTADRRKALVARMVSTKK